MENLRLGRDFSGEERGQAHLPNLLFCVGKGYLRRPEQVQCCLCIFLNIRPGFDGKPLIKFLPRSSRLSVQPAVRLPATPPILR
jgi:hypothetical protein